MWVLFYVLQKKTTMSYMVSKNSITRFPFKELSLRNLNSKLAINKLIRYYFQSSNKFSFHCGAEMFIFTWDISYFVQTNTLNFSIYMSGWACYKVFKKGIIWTWWSKTLMSVVHVSKRSQENMVVLLVLYVGWESWCVAIIIWLSKQFDIKDLGETSYILRLKLW